MEPLSISLNLKPLEVDDNLNLHEYATPRYGDGNVESELKEREMFHRSSDKSTSHIVNKFIHIGDESSSPENQPYPLCRLKYLGKGQSSQVYKSVLVDRLAVCAEKVVVVGNASKRVQLVRELESLKYTLYPKNGSDNNESSSKCPYIVNLLDVIPNPRDGTLSVCLEYMDGGSLQEIVMMGGCSQERILLGIASQMLNGLVFLHSNRIIHRDLKPSNTLFSSTGVVKLADFGLAKALDENNSMADSFIGTFDYMSPERLKGGNYSFVSDIWSFGLTIHAVAVGRYPYVGANGYWSIMLAINEQAPPLPPAKVFSQDFIDFIAYACIKDPAQRPTAVALLQHPFMTQQTGDISNIVSNPSSPRKTNDSGCESESTAPLTTNDSFKSLSDINKTISSEDESKTATIDDTTLNSRRMSVDSQNLAPTGPLVPVIGDQPLPKSPPRRPRYSNRSQSNSMSEDTSTIGIAVGSHMTTIRSFRHSNQQQSRRGNSGENRRLLSPNEPNGENLRIHMSPTLERRSRKELQRKAVEESADFLRKSLHKGDFQRLRDQVNRQYRFGYQSNVISKDNSSTNTPLQSRAESRQKNKEATKLTRPGNLQHAQSAAVVVNNGNTSIGKPIKPKSSKTKRVIPSASAPSLDLLPVISSNKTSTNPSPRQSQIKSDTKNLPNIPVVKSPTTHVPPITISSSTTLVPSNESSTTVTGMNSIASFDSNISSYNTPRNPVPVYHNHVGEFSSSRRQSRYTSQTSSPDGRSDINADSPVKLTIYPKSPGSDDGTNHLQSAWIMKIIDCWKLYLTRQLTNPSRKTKGLAEILGRASIDSNIHQYRITSQSQNTLGLENNKYLQWNINQINEFGMISPTKDVIDSLSNDLHFNSSNDLYQAFCEAIHDIEKQVFNGNIVKSRSFMLQSFNPSQRSTVSINSPVMTLIEDSDIKLSDETVKGISNRNSSSSYSKGSGLDITSDDWSPVGSHTSMNSSSPSKIKILSSNRRNNRTQLDDNESDVCSDSGELLDDITNSPTADFI